MTEAGPPPPLVSAAAPNHVSNDEASTASFSSFPCLGDTGPVLDWDLMSSAERPDMSACYHTNAVIVPCILLLLCLPYYLSLAIRQA